MGHGHAVSLNGKMPAPFCATNWRQMVGGLVATGIVVLAISIGSHKSLEPVPPVAGAPLPRSPVAPVALALEPGSAQDGNVQLVAQNRTAFNSAARAVRPSVVGIRAALGAGQGTERIGSGVTVDARGYIVTCNHVVNGATSIFANRFRQPERWLPAKVVAVQEDLALLQVQDATPFVPAKLGSSAQVEVGDWVLAVGHPFGLGLTVTAGIVGRRHGVLTLANGQRYTGLIQTDAPINEGSSGGPLVNTQGEVVGLNTAIYAPTGVFSGAGFAIPSDRIQSFVAATLGGGAPDLAARGVAAAAPGFQVPSLSWGLGLRDLSADIIAQLRYPRAQGVWVSSVEINSPADRAQLARGDVIVAIAGQPVSDLQSVHNARTRLDPRGAVTLQIWRQGRTHTVILDPSQAKG